MKNSNLGATVAVLLFLGVGIYFWSTKKIVEQSKCDQIDQDFIAAIKALPETGTILDENKKINLNNLLLFQKAYFNHLKEREYDNYYKF